MMMMMMERRCLCTPQSTGQWEHTLLCVLPLGDNCLDRYKNNQQKARYFCNTTSEETVNLI